jgi:hypothetical protein
MSLSGRNALVTGVSRRAGIGCDDAGWITGQTINSEGGFRRLS